MEKEKKERRSSILKPSQFLPVDNFELSSSTTNVVKRRVSFRNIRTVQEFDAEHSNIVHSPHIEPIKLHDTGSSDGVSSGQILVAAHESKSGETITDILSRTVENFAPMTTSTPLYRSKELNVCHDDSTFEGGDTCSGTAAAGREEMTYIVDRISEENTVVDDNLKVEPMELSDSEDVLPPTNDVTKFLFRRSTVGKTFEPKANQQSTLVDASFASIATRVIFKPVGNCSRRNSAANETSLQQETLASQMLDNRTVDMDISSGNTTDEGEEPEVPVNSSGMVEPHGTTSTTTDGAASVVLEENDEVRENAENSAREDDGEGRISEKASPIDIEEPKNIIVTNSNDSITYVKQSEDGQQSKTHRSLTLEDETSMKTEESRNAVSHTDIAVAAELSSQLDRQHISNESSIRKIVLDSPTALPKKKIRLFSPKVTSPPKTSSLFGSPKPSGSGHGVSPPNKRNLENESPASNISADKKLSEIKHRLRRSLNQSGICTLQELTPLDGESVVMLNDISVPEPLFEEHELNSHVSAEETLVENVTEVNEQSNVESSPLSSRQSEVVVGVLGNESSFALTSRVDTVGFDINVRTVPCLRIKANDDPRIVELKQLATMNLQKRLAEVVESCKNMIDAELQNYGDRKMAECIRTLNPRKLSRREANWFDVCYLMAQREWFMFRAALASVTSEKLNELLLETEAEYESKKQLMQCVEEYRQNHHDMEERLTVMKKVDEAASSAAEDEQRYKQLKKEAAELRLQAARREIELTKQQCARLNELLNEYEKTKAEQETYDAWKAGRQAEYQRRYEETMVPYRDLYGQK